jgi:acetolactate synthase-1/2/3 large subunit
VVAFEAVANDHYLHQATTTFVCDIGAGLDALGRGVAPTSAWTEAAVADARAEVLAPFDPGEPWGPSAVVDGARRALPRETIATADVGAHRIVLSQVWQSLAPRTLLQSNGLCTMGCGVPFAIGAKLAEPDRPVVCFTGDGGLLMVLGELATAAEQRLPIIVVCFVDRSLALIELKQQDRQLARQGVAIGRLDVVRIAEGLGGRGVAVDGRAGLAAALETALAADRFTLIACQIDADGYVGRV